MVEKVLNFLKFWYSKFNKIKTKKIEKLGSILRVVGNLDE
jgi:hypothetical protein